MDFFQKAQELISNNQQFVICIITATSGSVPRKAGSKMIVLPDKTSFGTIGGGNIEYQAINFCSEVLQKGLSEIKKYKLEEDLGMQCGGYMEVYFEPFNPAINLYIFGAGHIGKNLAKYANGLGFKATLIDNRTGIYDQSEIPGIAFINEDYFDAIDSLSFTGRDFFAIVTHKHIHDEEILNVLAQKPFAYLGMIGSKKKVAEVKSRLIESKLFDDETIERINMPMGIKFNAQTPEEIAISIIAKIIDIRNNLANNHK